MAAGVAAVAAAFGVVVVSACASVVLVLDVVFISAYALVVSEAELCLWRRLLLLLLELWPLTEL